MLLLLSAGGWGASDYHSCVGFNSCTMYMDGPPYSVVCPWLAVAGLLVTCEFENKLFMHTCFYRVGSCGLQGLAQLHNCLAVAELLLSLSVHAQLHYAVQCTSAGVRCLI
jgi:hypothetical protein